MENLDGRSRNTEPPEFCRKSREEGVETSVGCPGFCRSGIQSMEVKGFLGSGWDQEPLEYSSRAWSEVGAGKPSVIPEFLRNFWTWTTNPSDSQPGIPIPILLSLIFPRSLSFPIGHSRFFRRFPLLPSSRSVAFCMRLFQHDQSARGSRKSALGCSRFLGMWSGNLGSMQRGMVPFLHPKGNPKSRWEGMGD